MNILVGDLNRVNMDSKMFFLVICRVFESSNRRRKKLNYLCK